MNPDTCPECSSQDIRVLWRAKDDDDVDGLMCADCQYRWTE